MAELTLEEVKKKLQEKQLDPKIQSETNQVYAILDADDREFPIFARIYQGRNLLQLIAFFPTQPLQKTIPDIARLLHVFNKELDIPGFGIDELSRIVYFRCMIPTPKGKLDPDLFDSFYGSIVSACKTFAQSIDAVGSGVTTFEDLMRKAQEKSKGQ